MAKAAAVFDHFADHGNPRMLGWEAFPTAVRGCGFDPTEKQLADIWKNVTATSDDKAEGNRITYQQFSAALQSAPGLADVDSALALLIGPRSLTPAEAKTLLTTAGDDPLSDAEWNAFEDLVFPDGAARTSSDILAVFREEDPASRSFAPRFNPRPPDPDLETGAPPADKGLAAEVEETGKDSTYVYTAPKGGDVLASAESNMHKSVTLAERGTSLSTHAEARNLSNELFKLVDKDNSGKISPSEFDTLKSIVAEVSADFIPENISELDRNADKEVDEGEWTKHMDAAMRSMGPQKFVDTCFSTLSRVRDAFGDGSRLHPWIDIDFSSLGQERKVIDGADKRGIMLSQLRKLLEFINSHADDAGNLKGWWDRFTKEPLHKDTVNLYAVADWIIKPFTAKATSSYVELVADEGTVEQIPKWFVSHWWGEPVLDFIKCTARHAQVRELGEGACYWVCAYANNQHELGKDIGSDPRDWVAYPGLGAHGGGGCAAATR